MNGKILLLLGLGAVLIAAPLTVILREHARQQAVYEAIFQEVRTHRARPMTASGIFYPAELPVLSQELDKMLAAAEAPRLGAVRGLVVPHGQYSLTGMTAAAAYKLLAGADIRTVILLVPSHFAVFQGAYVSSVEAYATPLGLIPLSPKARTLAGITPFTSSFSCAIQRPAWWQQFVATVSARGAETPDTWEFAAEVQLPFLQKTLRSFDIVPVVYGQVNPVDAAKALEPLLDDKTLVIATTYLSELHPDEEARQIDRQSLTSICTLNDGRVAAAEADGKGPILTLLHLARAKGWKTQHLAYHNTSEVTNDRTRVLGYGSVAFYQPQNADIRPHDSAEKKAMLQLARRCLEAVVHNGKLPPVDEKAFAGRLREPLPCFVTLLRKGVSRGCAGDIQTDKPLFQGIMENTLKAALRDPEVTPVQVAELPDIDIRIDILTTPEPLYCDTTRELLDRLQPGRDGVILRAGQNIALHLPLTWETMPDKEAFLAALSAKACGSADAWKTSPVTIYTFRTEALRESDK